MCDYSLSSVTTAVTATISGSAQVLLLGAAHQDTNIESVTELLTRAGFCGLQLRLL